MLIPTTVLKVKDFYVGQVINLCFGDSARLQAEHYDTINIHHNLKGLGSHPLLSPHPLLPHSMLVPQKN